MKPEEIIQGLRDFAASDMGISERKRALIQGAADLIARQQATLDKLPKSRSEQRKCRHDFKMMPWHECKARWMYRCAKCGAKARG
jgi:hypothetical protein